MYLFAHSHIGKAVDMWSLGVILYVLLAGELPFSHDNEKVLTTKIKKGSFQFSRDLWLNVSDSVKDLIRKLLTVDAKKRLSIDQALSHHWLQEGDDYLAKKNLSNNLNGIKKLLARKRWKKAINAVKLSNKLKDLMMLRKTPSKVESSERPNEGLLPETPAPAPAELPPAVSKTAPVSKIVGKYTIEPQILGKGKHSIVKKAINQEENEEVAVKIVDLNNPAVPLSYQIELNNEVAILSTLNHPNIVTLYESIEISSIRYVFMEYIIGGELLERLKQEKFYSEKKARRVIQALVEAISYLHENDIVHR